MNVILRGARRVMLSRRNGRRLSRPDMEVFLLGCAGPRVQGVRRAPPWIRGCAPEIAAGTLRAGGWHRRVAVPGTPRLRLACLFYFDASVDNARRVRGT